MARVHLYFDDDGDNVQIAMRTSKGCTDASHAYRVALVALHLLEQYGMERLAEPQIDMEMMHEEQSRIIVPSKYNN